MKPKESPFSLVFTAPQKAAEKFLHQPDCKNIAFFLFLLSAFLSLLGQYPREFSFAISTLLILFGGSFLYVLLLMWWGGKNTQKEYWKIFCSLSLAQMPIIVGRIVISLFLFLFFGKVALYDGVEMLMELPQDSFVALFLFFEAVVFSSWSLYAEIRIVSHIQKVAWGYALVRILICSLSVTFLSLVLLSPFAPE